MVAAERGADLLRASWILPSNPVATRIDRAYARQAAINDIGELVKQSAVSLRKPAASKLTAAQQLWWRAIGSDNDGYPQSCLEASGK
jgi:hypothetical protein